MRLIMTVAALLSSAAMWADTASAQVVLPVKSTYSGIFYEANDLWQQSSGFLTLRATTSSRYSAKMVIGPYRYSFTGYFDETGRSTTEILRYQLEPLSIDLQLDAEDPDLIYGTVSSDDWVADVILDRAVFDGKFSVCPDAGQYTMVIPGQLGSTTSPAGDSYGTITVDRRGVVRFAGALADGSRVSLSTTLSKGGQWPLYIPVYRGYGSLHGWMLFNGSADEDLAGDITWIKPRLSGEWYYPGGFATVVYSWGSRYTRPAKGTPIIDLPLGNAEFNGGNLGRGITNTIAIDERNRVLNSSPNGLTMKFSTGNGLVTGKVMHPVSWQWISFRGVVLQKFDVIAGFFLGRDQSGEVWVENK